MNIKSILLSVAIIHYLLFFSGCGYKPSSYYAKTAIEGKVYVNVAIKIDNSSNSVFIKDAINEMIINQFDSVLSYNKAQADTVVDAELSSVSHTALQTDDEGYSKTYRTTVTISIKYNNRKQNKSNSFTVTNYYDYTVDADSVVTEQKKQEAIKLSSQKALSDIFSKIAIRNI